MRLLIATWGEPATWKAVRYRFGGEEQQSCSTLGIIKKVINPDRTIVIVSDTLAEFSKGINTCGKKESDQNVELEKSDYKGVLEFINTYIRKTLEAFNVSADDIWILPSVGYFPKITAKGNLSDLRYALFVKFFDIFEDLLKEEKVEIFLDITHGQNFLPSFTYEVLKTVLGILALFVKDVRLTVLNSDPFVPSAKPEFLEIHRVIDNLKIAPQPYGYYSKRYDFIAPFGKGGKSFKEIRDKVDKIKNNKIPLRLIDYVPAFLGAVYHGLPLLLFYGYLEPAYAEELLDTVFETYYENVEISEQNGRLIMEKKIRLRPEVEVFAIYGMLLKGLKEKYPFIEEYSFYKTRDEEKISIPLDKLKEISGLFYFSEKNKAILEKELTDIKRIIICYLCSKGSFDWTPFIDLEIKNLKRAEEEEEEENPQKETEGTPATLGNEERNFFAHGGLIKKAIELKGDNEKIYIRYIPKNRYEDKKILIKLKTVLDWAKEGLNQLS